MHHKNYGCLGKEQNADVIILCDDCHSRTHEKPKWRKRLRNNEELDFTGLSDKGRKRKYYNLGSSESRECKRCGEVHEIYYFLMKNGKMLLRMNCPNSNPRAMPIPFEPGLDIPVIQSRKK